MIPVLSMASYSCHSPNQQPSFGLSLPGEMSNPNSTTNSLFVCAADVDTRSTSIDGGLAKTPSSPKLKVVPQRPGPNGSRVVRKRCSIPRLGAGLGALVQISSSLKPAETPTTIAQHKSVAEEVKSPEDGCTSINDNNDNDDNDGRSTPEHGYSGRDISNFLGVNGKINLETTIPSKTAQPPIDGEIENTSVPYGSPASSTEGVWSLASSNSFDGIDLSSPNSTPPPSKERVYTVVDSSPHTTTTANNYPFQPITGHLPTRTSMPHLADKLANVVPFPYMNVGDNKDSQTAHLATTAPHHELPTTSAPFQPAPFLGPTNPQVKHPSGAQQLNNSPNRSQEFEKQKGSGCGAAPQIYPAKQLDQGHNTVPFNAHWSNIVFKNSPAEEYQTCFVPPGGTYPLTCPPGLSLPAPTQQPSLPFRVLPQVDKLHSLELKLQKYVHMDENSAESSSTGVHVFVDMSNIGIGFINAVKEAQGIPISRFHNAPMSFVNLARILERGRNVQKRVLAGSLAFPASRRENWPSHLREAENLNYGMNIFDRVQVEKKISRPRRRRSALYSPNDITSADESPEDKATAKISKVIRKNGEQGVGKSRRVRVNLPLVPEILSG